MYKDSIKLMEFSSMCYISHRLKYLPMSFNIKSQGIFLCYEKVGILEKYNYQDIDKDEVKELIVGTNWQQWHSDAGHIYIFDG